MVIPGCWWVREDRTNNSIRHEGCGELKTGPLKAIHVKSLKLVRVTLFGERVFADVIKLRILR